LEEFIMPIGKEIGSFSLTSTSMTKGVDSTGNHTFVMNMEGQVSGGWNGTVLATIIATTADINTGSYTISVAVYLDDGEVLTGSGCGIIRSLGGHKWRLNGVDLISDGTCIASEGDLELATRTYSGNVFELT
jgi:hypothetical protein